MFLTAAIGFFAVSYGKVIFFQNIIFLKVYRDEKGSKSTILSMPYKQIINRSLLIKLNFYRQAKADDAIYCL